MPYEIYDSEEDEGDLDDYTGDEMDDAVAVVPAPNPQASLGSPEKQSLPTSGELRQLEINAARAALLAPSSPPPDASIPKTATEPVSALERVEKGGKGIGGNQEGDIYDFPDGSDDDDVQLISAVTKPAPKRKRSNTTRKSKDLDSGPDFDNKAPSTKSRKRTNSSTTSTKKRKKSAEMDISEDDYDPTAKVNSGPGPRKSTRSNTKDEELTQIPPRKQRNGRRTSKEVNYYIPPPPGSTSGDDLEEGRGDTSREKSTPKPTERRTGIMVDLTSDDLIIPTQRKLEYPIISPEISTFQTESTVPIASDNGPPSDAVQSTIPDPSGLEPPPGISNEYLQNLKLEFTPGTDPVHSSVPDEFDENTQVLKKKNNKTVGELGEVDLSAFSVASEWRAAKGKKNIDYTGRKKSGSENDSGFQSSAPVTERDPVKKPVKEKEKRKPGRKKSKMTEEIEAPQSNSRNSTGSTCTPTADVSETAVGDTVTVDSHTTEVSDTKGAEEPLAPLRLKLNVKPMNEELGQKEGEEEDPVITQPDKSKRRKRNRKIDSDDEDQDDYVEGKIELLPPPVEEKEEEKEPPKTKRGRKTKRKVSEIVEDPLAVDELALEPTKRTKSNVVEAATGDIATVAPAKKGKGGRKKSKVAEAEAKLSLKPDIDENLETTQPTISALAEKERNTVLLSTKSESDATANDDVNDTKLHSNFERARSEVTPAPRSEDKKQHSPIRGGKVPYRVGLSKRARIEPLLKIRRK